VLDLALNDSQSPVRLSVISQRQDISLYYLEQLFNKLKRGGIVRSKQGAGGGYTLSRSAREITVGDIIRCVEGPVSPVECEGGRRGRCLRIDSCPTTGLWKQLGEKIENFLDSVTIKELGDEAARCEKTVGAE
jgi:Rrf2 family iron-sulfur cluster assembly transcriptional regulator